MEISSVDLDKYPEKIIVELQNQLAEKDAMIDWLAESLARITFPYVKGTKEKWKEMAQEAVKRDERL